MSTNSEANKLKKLTLKAIGAVPARKDVAAGETKYLATVYGQVRKYQTIMTASGLSAKYSGEFEAINAAGERYASERLMLPNQFDAAFMQACDAREHQAEPLQFAVAVSVKHDSRRNSAGFSYCVRAVIPTSVRDPMAEIRSKVATDRDEENARALAAIAERERAEKETAERKARDEAAKNSPLPNPDKPHTLVKPAKK